jgi:DNA-binding MarR family transcriptional regulator
MSRESSLVKYDELAAELLQGMKSLHRVKPQKDIQEALQGEAFILDYIASHEGDVLPSEIGNKMEVSSARIATALNSLEKKGLVTRQIDTQDRRMILIAITQEGRKIAKKHQEAVLRVATKMLRLLGEHDAKEYVRIQKRLAEILPTCEELM